MPRKRAFCLVENREGEILLIQHGYGKRKGKWSLWGGFVDQGESGRHAAYRETREETGSVVETIHRPHKGNTRPMEIIVGRPVGGGLKFQRRECLDVRWLKLSSVNYDRLALG